MAEPKVDDREQMRFTLRPALVADSVDILRISNDPEVRLNSFRSDPIAFDEHSIWFQRHLEDPHRPFYVLEVDGVIAGQVRFDPQGTGLRLSYSIAPEFRGKGLARILVGSGCDSAREALGKLDIHATTRGSNPRSQRVLESVGFRRLQETPDRVEFVLTGDALIRRTERPATNS